MKTRRHILFMGTAAMAVTTVVLAPAAAQRAADFSLSGSAGVEARWFSRHPAFPDQLDGTQSSLILSPEFRWRTEGRRHQFSFAPYGRIDAEDDERTHFDVREAYWRLVEDDWELLVGVNKVFWGVTESRHLVDILNQVDLVEDIDEEDRLGQQMINLAFQRDWGRLDLYVLPGFRERTFPGEDGRLRAPLVVNTGAARYESSDKDDRIDLAARWSHYETYVAFAPRGYRSFRMAIPVWLKEKLFQKRLLRDKLRAHAPDYDWESRLLFTEHHQSHAASAFFPSPFEDAVVLTMDGVGEWATTSVGMGHGNALEMTKEIHFPHSLGLLYSAFTYYTGFKVNSGEYKVMGQLQRARRAHCLYAGGRLSLLHGPGIVVLAIGD